MDAIVLAGGLNRPDDPLYTLTGVEKKALIPMAGQPMINWIVEALSGSGLVEHIVIVGLKPDDASFNHRPVHFVDRAGGIIDNVMAAVDR
ncbi:MAG TPA: NTP transferase domain-containing protein, partial [Anaerolineae bacterium]